jgi:uncharacterized protein
MTAPAATSSASTQPDTSHFNSLQTTGREYRNLSVDQHTMTRDIDQRVPLRDGGFLLSDVNAPSPAHVPGCSASSPVPATSFGAVSTNLRAQGGHR